MLTVNVGGNEQGCTTDAAGSSASLHPVTLHALHQPQRCVGHGILLLPAEVSALAHQLVHKAVYVQAGINGPAVQHRDDDGHF